MAAPVTRRMPAGKEICTSTVLVMSMTQLVFGTALGFFVAQGVLYSVQHLIGWLRRSDARKRILEPTPTLASTLIGRFTKYATLAGTSGGCIPLGVCAVGDHLAA